MDNSYTVKASLGTLATDSYDFVNRIFANPNVILIIFIVFLAYLLIFSSLGENSNATLDGNGESQGSSFLIIILVSLFFILILLNGFQYFFGIDIVATVKNLFSKTPELEITVGTEDDKSETAEENELGGVSNITNTGISNSTSNSITGINNTGISNNTNNENSKTNFLSSSPEVFNIGENVYDYEDAKAVCKAYGSRLATYKEVEDAYQNGGEWCNYGWSEDQMILFPTQQETWDHLQKIEGHKNDCGRPGVNGGYIDNPNIKYGVNCYGVRPAMSSTEQQLMSSIPKYPKTKKDIEEENRVEYWKSKKNEILVSPFNHNNWSKV